MPVDDRRPAQTFCRISDPPAVNAKAIRYDAHENLLQLLGNKRRKEDA
jgi:hypothetical protein